jgi:hypothetical protein
MEADWVAQNWAGNYSTAHFYVKCINRGGTGSYDNNQGSQVWQMDGVASNGHWSTLPSGVPTNGQRWYDGPWGVDVGHDGNGYGADRWIRQIISGWFSFNDAAILPAPARIPKRPSPPGTPTASNVLPQSMTLSWTGSTDNAGSAVDYYLLRRFDNAAGTGSYTDYTTTGLSYNVSGLTPGKTYSWRVYAHNGAADNGGYSNASGMLTKATMAPLRVKVGGVYKYAVPYVKVNGAYKSAVPMGKRAGIYRMPT